MSRWEGIEEFVAVANHGSFVSAARALGVSTSHVSRSIANLEKALNTPVLLRTTRKVTLTDSGRVLAEQFRRVLEERERALAMASQSQEPHGTLRVTCSTGLGERVIVPVLRQYAIDYPSLQVQIDLTNRLVDLVGEGYDLAIRTGDLADSSLIATRLASRRSHVCASPAYLSANGTPASLSDLDSHKCLVGSNPTWAFLIGGEERLIKPRPYWRCNSGDAITSAALADMGICQLPEFYVAAHLAEGRLIKVLDDLRRSDEPVWAVYPQKRHLQPKIRVLVDRLKRDLGAALTPSL